MNTKQKQRKAKLGKRNPRWKGGKAKSSGGYITLASGKPGGNDRPYEHDVIAKVKKGQVAHHKNKNRADNSRRNLQATRRHRGIKKGIAKKVAEPL